MKWKLKGPQNKTVNIIIVLPMVINKSRKNFNKMLLLNEIRKKYNVKLLLS